MVYRPLLVDPPLCLFTDLVLPGRLTISDLYDMNELIDLRSVVIERSRSR